AVPRSETWLLRTGLLIVLLTKLPIFRYFRMGHGIWRFATVADLRRILMASVCGSGLFILAMIGLAGPRFPRSVYIMDFVLTFLVASGGRLCVRMYYEALLDGARS